MIHWYIVALIPRTYLPDEFELGLVFLRPVDSNAIQNLE